MLITLGNYGFWDEEDPDVCFGVELFVNGKSLWKSELYDAHPEEHEDSIREIRNELEEALEKFGIPVEEVVNYSSNSTYDWGLNYETEV